MSINSFNSQENKSVLWQFLLENNFFIGLSDKKFNKVKDIFEKNIQSISIVNDSISNKNKILIQKMMEELELLKSKNISKPLQEVRLEIENDLKNKQEEFVELIKRPEPKNLDFNDEKDEPISNDNMDKILKKMMEDRDLESNLENPGIKSSNPEKKVTFANIDFIDKLKKIDNEDNVSTNSSTMLNFDKFKNLDLNSSSNNNIQELLLKILENQEKILKHFKI
tara:strand:- start:7580 stop:8251 length:672 start_codon:yes stop_codon:yes gene_type:complete